MSGQQELISCGVTEDIDRPWTTLTHNKNKKEASTGIGALF